MSTQDALQYTQDDIPVLGRLVNITQEGVIANAEQIWDAEQQKFQSEINKNDNCVWVVYIKNDVLIEHLSTKDETYTLQIDWNGHTIKELADIVDNGKALTIAFVYHSEDGSAYFTLDICVALKLGTAYIVGFSGNINNTTYTNDCNFFINPGEVDIKDLPEQIDLIVHPYNLCNNKYYLLKTEADQIYAKKSDIPTGGGITTETDPVFSASVASSIKQSDIDNWNSKTSNTGTLSAIRNGAHKVVEAHDGLLDTSEFLPNIKLNNTEYSITQDAAGNNIYDLGTITGEDGYDGYDCVKSITINGGIIYPNSANNIDLGTVGGSQYIQSIDQQWFNVDDHRLTLSDDFMNSVNTQHDEVSALRDDLYNLSETVESIDFNAIIDKLEGIATGAEVNVQSDWNVTNTSSDAFIKNKPTIPTKTSQLTNDSNFVTDASTPVVTINHSSANFTSIVSMITNQATIGQQSMYTNASGSYTLNSNKNESFTSISAVKTAYNNCVSFKFVNAGITVLNWEYGFISNRDTIILHVRNNYQQQFIVVLTEDGTMACGTLDRYDYTSLFYIDTQKTTASDDISALMYIQKVTGKLANILHSENTSGTYAWYLYKNVSFDQLSFGNSPDKHLFTAVEYTLTENTSSPNFYTSSTEISPSAIQQVVKMYDAGNLTVFQV